MGMKLFFNPRARWMKRRRGNKLSTRQKEKDYGGLPIKFYPNINEKCYIQKSNLKMYL